MGVFLLGEHLEQARVVRHARASQRLRLEVEGLRGNGSLGRRLEHLLATWPGVIQAQAEPRSGRLLVRYSEGAPLLERLTEEPEPLRPRRSLRGPRAPAPSAPWHALGAEQVLSRLHAHAEGLSEEQAATRLRRHGPNLTEAAQPRSRLAVLGSQVANVPMAILLGSAGASALAGDMLEASAILVVVGLNAAIGYHVERRNEELLSSWQRLEAGTAQVLRGGQLLQLPAAELVPGDVLLCRAGDVLPADVRVLEAHRLSCDEAALTGESEPVPKHVEPVAEQAPLAERTCMLYAGTTLVSGHGRALVVATGADTEMARVRHLVEQASASAPPLARRLEQLDRRIAATALGAAALSGLAGLLHGRPARQVLRGAVALGVAALPEGLPLVATAGLVRSMQRLHARGMVVRRLAAAEALGGITVICSDKTGTLTYNRMRLEVLDLGQGPLQPSQLRAQPEHILEHGPTLALASGLLNSDVDVHRNGHEVVVAGSSTEQALVAAAHAAGLDGAALRQAFPRRRLLERTQGVHYVVSLHGTPEGGGVSFVKGAPEQVLELCDKELHGPLTPSRRRQVLRRNEALAAEGLRVLALGWQRLPRPGAPAPEGGYTLIGLVGLRDMLREGAADSVRLARRAGIRTLILTGDQPRTAESIARQVGLEGETLGVAELEHLLRRPGQELAERLDRLAVLARVAPEHKVALVQALRAQGERVAMAGDGVNDAPALRAADVGVAVGASATDLTRQVADVVMASEDLRSLMVAVGEGRIVQDNLRRALRFLLATNLSEMSLVVGASLLGLPEPLSPLQLLWINLLTDTLPALALALEPGDPEVLDRPPAPPQAPLLPASSVRRIGRDGLAMAGLGALGWAAGGRPLAFSALTAAQLGYVLACRAPHSARGQEGDGGRFALLVGSGAVLQLMALTAPPLRQLLGLPPPSPWVLGASVAGLLAPGLVAARPDRIHRVIPTVEARA